MLPRPKIFPDLPPEPQTNLTLALNLATKSKCFFRSVARMASMTRKRKCLNSTWSRLTRKLYSGLDMKRFQAAAAWWFSSTERSLYSTACGGTRVGELSGAQQHPRMAQLWLMANIIRLCAALILRADLSQCITVLANCTGQLCPWRTDSKHRNKGNATWKHILSLTDISVLTRKIGETYTKIRGQFCSQSNKKIMFSN